MYNIFLVRHGESQSNAGEPTSNPEEVELTERGHVESRLVAHYFKQHDISLNLLVTSPYRRAIQTAAYTREYFPAVATEEWDVQEFTYLSSLHRRATTIGDRRPLVEDYWNRLLPFARDTPDSESFASFIARVRYFIAWVRADLRGNIVVFSHEQFINAVLWLCKYESIKVSRQAMEEYRDYCKQHRIPNGGIVKAQISQRQIFWQPNPITKHLQCVEMELNAQQLEPVGSGSGYD
jgi:2,3-bisphosphoglycerate-dependent phosphoglycerate mutase